MIKFKHAPRREKGKITTFIDININRARRSAKRVAIVFVAVGMLVTSTVLTSSPTLAWDGIKMDMNAVKYLGNEICVGSTLNPAYYPVGAIAQQWNIVANREDGVVLELDFSTNCAADGYTPRQTMTIGAFNNPNHNSCLAVVNDAKTQYSDSNMFYWQHGPGVYINVGIPSCVSTAQRRSHQVAAAIGYPLGLEFQSASGWSQRVMCTCSLDTLRAPTYAEGTRVKEIYQNKYGGTF